MPENSLWRTPENGENAEHKENARECQGMGRMLALTMGRTPKITGRTENGRTPEKGENPASEWGQRMGLGEHITFCLENYLCPGNSGNPPVIPGNSSNLL